MKAKLQIALTILLMCAATEMTSQHHLFLEMGIDPRMAIEGPYKDKSNDTNGGTFNAEFKVGLEWEKSRIGFGYEMHEAIKYQKWSLFYEHNFNDMLVFFNLTNFITRIGPEASMIIRRDPPEDHRDHTVDWVQLGANLGIYYNINYKKCETGFQIGINGNIFRGEEHYRGYAKTFIDEFRTDFMVVLIRNF